MAFESQSHSVTLLQHFIVQFFCACSVWTCGRGHFTGKNITMYFFFSLSLHGKGNLEILASHFTHASNAICNPNALLLFYFWYGKVENRHFT